MSVERNTQHGDGEHERERHACLVAFGVAFVDTPDEAGCQQDDVHDDTRVEGHAQRVDKEQFEPSAHFHDARHDAVEYGCYQYARSQQCQQGAFGIGVGHFLIVIHQYDGRQAEQVQQVHADAQAGQVGDKNQPAVTVGFVGNVFPFQYQPEYHGGEQGGEGIDFAFHGTEPECIAERIGQCAHQAAAHDGHHLSACDIVFVRRHEFAHQVRDAPEEEQDTCAAHQRAHVVHHFGHGGGIGSKL